MLTKLSVCDQVNLLVCDQKSGKLSDFGLAVILEDATFNELRSYVKGNYRWLSPEALDGVWGIEADVWSWAWLVWEVCASMSQSPKITDWTIAKLFTGKVPFYEVRAESRMISQFALGKLSPRVDEMQVPYESLRAIMTRCWNVDATTRISVRECEAEIQRLVRRKIWRRYTNPENSRAQIDSLSETSDLCSAPNQPLLTSIASTSGCHPFGTDNVIPGGSPIPPRNGGAPSGNMPSIGVSPQNRVEEGRIDTRCNLRLGTTRTGLSPKYISDLDHPSDLQIAEVLTPHRESGFGARDGGPSIPPNHGHGSPVRGHLPNPMESHSIATRGAHDESQPPGPPDTAENTPEIASSNHDRVARLIGRFCCCRTPRRREPRQNDPKQALAGEEPTLQLRPDDNDENLQTGGHEGDVALFTCSKALPTDYICEV